MGWQASDGWGALLFIPDAVLLGENIPYQLAYVSVPTISFQSLAPYTLSAQRGTSTARRWLEAHPCRRAPRAGKPGISNGSCPPHVPFTAEACVNM